LDWEVLNRLGLSFDLWLFLPLAAAFTLIQIPGAWRWQEVLKCHGLKQSLLQGARLYLVGYFFNNFLPTAIGGDMVRGYESGRRLGSLAQVYTSILMERLLGLLACLTLALLFLPWVKPPQSLCLMVMGLNIVAWLAMALVLWSRTHALIDWLVKRLPAKISQKLTRITGSLAEYQGHIPRLGMGFLAALVYQAGLIWVAWLGGFLAGFTFISLADYLVFVPLIWVLSLLPITFNALGVREISFAYFFSLLGGEPEQGVLVSLILFVTILLTSLSGGILWWMSGEKLSGLRRGSKVEPGN
jgi:uncharacterized protein (TIRG00374 family)